MIVRQQVTSIELLHGLFTHNSLQLFCWSIKLNYKHLFMEIQFELYFYNPVGTVII